MKKVIFLFFFCTSIVTSLELATPSLYAVFANSVQNSADRPSQMIDSPNSTNAPSAGNSDSGLAEKGKPILDRNAVICPQILKTDNNSNKSSENPIPAAGKGQVPSSCLHL
jgi:hypothetical protein